MLETDLRCKPAMGVHSQSRLPRVLSVRQRGMADYQANHALVTDTNVIGETPLVDMPPEERKKWSCETCASYGPFTRFGRVCNYSSSSPATHPRRCCQTGEGRDMSNARRISSNRIRPSCSIPAGPPQSTTFQLRAGIGSYLQSSIPATRKDSVSRHYRIDYRDRWPLAHCLESSLA